MSEKEKLIDKVLGIIKGELPFQVVCQKGFIYAWSLDSQFSGRIGFNVTKKLGNGRIGLNPIVGVRSDQIESLVEKLSHSGEDRFEATVNISLGYLMPEKRYLEWVFAAQPDFDYVSEAKKIAKAIEVYGLPFMMRNATLDAIADDLEQLRFSFKESAVYRLPVAYFLLHKPELAMTFVKEQLKVLDGRQDAAALQYRTFGAAFLQEVSAGPASP
jgi:hypothetical protein